MAFPESKVTDIEEERESRLGGADSNLTMPYLASRWNDRIYSELRNDTA